MMMPLSSMLLPYLTLGLFIAGLFVIPSRRMLAFLLTAQIIFAFHQGIMTPTGVFAITAFWGVCALHWRNPSSKEGLNTIRALFIAAIAIAFASHLVPGFHNVRLFNSIQVSPMAASFTMYLNFDKTVAAVILVMASGLFLKQTTPFGIKAWRETGIIATLCISLLIPLAVLSGYVTFDPKFPEIFWLWAFNNLFFVCFSEEIIFRGIIQTHLLKLTKRWNISPFIPILISALLFAVLLPGHRQGGPVYMAFVTLAGIFYGYAYHRTNRLESAIWVHFLLNLYHFLAFSYPMVAK